MDLVCPLRRWSRTLLSGLLMLPLSAAPAQAAYVASFFPRGTIKQVRQITARFSAPMVAFGDPRLITPFEVSCPAEGQGKWVNGRNWVYDFTRDLPAGLRCTFTLKPDLHTLSGDPIQGESSFSFSTGGPSILHSLPSEGDDIDEEQTFVLGLDAQADKASLLAHAHCSVSGLGEEIGVAVVEGDERREILLQVRASMGYYLTRLFRGNRGDDTFYFRPLPSSGTEEERFLALAEREDSPVAVVRCLRRLPSNEEMSLVWGRGIRSGSGEETTADQSLVFRVRKPFSALFRCQKMNRDAGCIPVLPMELSFSTPIAAADAQRIRLADEHGEHYPPRPHDGETHHVSDLVFPGPFPETTSFTLEIPSGLKDDADRLLDNADRFPLQVKTDRMPPLVKFPAAFGIVEFQGEAVLPVTVRNLESVLPLDANHPGSEEMDRAEQETATGLNAWWLSFREKHWPKPAQVRGHLLRVDRPEHFVQWMKRVNEARTLHVKGKQKRVYEAFQPGEESVFAETAPDTLETFTLPRPEGRKAFEVLGIPLRKPGMYVVELTSDRLGAALMGKKSPYYVQTAVLATNLSLHFKQGQESSLVWVTTLDQGRPAAGVEVTVGNCNGDPFFWGETDAQGMLFIPESLPATFTLPACGNHERAFLVTARLGEDETFLLSSWNQGIHPEQFNVPIRRPYYQSDLLSVTVFDRTLLRAGDTLSMKHYLRRPSGTGLAPPHEKDLPKQAVIRHVGSGQEYELSLTWDNAWTAESVWPIPQGAKAGVYEVLLAADSTHLSRKPVSGSFRVEVFRVPTMKATVIPVRTEIVPPAQVTADIQVSYLAGGGAAHAPVKIRGLVQPKTMTFATHEGFVFANGAIHAGPEEKKSARPLLEDDAFWFDGDNGTERLRDSRPLPVQSLLLDASGAARSVIENVEAADIPRDLLLELEYQDANGERLATSTHVTLLPSEVVLGLKADHWASNREQLKFRALALDPRGNPLAGTAVTVDLFQRKTYSHRKRMLGGFYAFDHRNEILAVKERFCSGTTNAQGLLLCEGPSPVSGNIIFAARAADGRGRPAFVHASAWVADTGQWWFEVDHNDRMDLLPEKKRYEPGEEAVLQVRMPFREATVLVTVEREGILDRFVQTLSGRNPVVRVPMRKEYAPNAFVSALAVRGRASGVEPTAMVDLGRPAFRLGFAELKVGWQAHELLVKVETDRSVYEPGQEATATVTVTPASGQPLSGEAEIALAAVDEGLLELKANDSWNLLSTMMRQRVLSVTTATAQQQVIGRRHYGRKSVPQGGDGGGGGRSRAGRQLLEPLLLWRGRVRLDERGQARVAIPLNDALSAFRVVAVAHAGVGLFGSGTTSFHTSQPLMLFSALPPLVREGDVYRGGFTVHNGGKQTMTVTLDAVATARANTGEEEPAPLPTLPPRVAPLAPGESREEDWEITVPVDVRRIDWRVHAVAEGAEDRLDTVQKVLPAEPVRVFQATLNQLERESSMDIARPEDALAGRGGVRVVWSNRLTEDLAAVREYLSSYPYTCFEQNVSKAVVLRDEEAWKGLMASLPGHLDKDGLVKYFPDQPLGGDVLTAYVISLARDNGWEIPKESRQTMIKGLRRFVTGEILRGSDLPTADLALRKMAALAAMAGHEPISGELLTTFDIEPNLWPTSGVIDWLVLLDRTKDLPDWSHRREEAVQILRSRLHFQGTTLGFSTERDDYLWWLMISADSNANRLLLALMNDPDWREDLPRLVKGALSRRMKGRWSTTTANAWGVTAMTQFAALFESTSVTGESSGRLEGKEQSLDWKAPPPDGILDFPWPDRGAATLSLRHRGEGRPWVTVQSRAAIPLTAPLSSGYHLTRTVSPVEQKTPGVWSRGDVMRVRLEMEAQSDMTWVVVNDPIPSGATLLGSGLGRDASIATRGEKREGWSRPAFEERSHEAYRVYYTFVPKGTWAVEYSIRLNASGRFHLPSSRVEAMYAPEMFGETPVAAITVAP